MGQIPPFSRLFDRDGVHIALLPRAAYCAHYTPSAPVAGFAFETQRGRHAFASDRHRDFHAPANGLAFTPGGCPIYSESRQGGEYLMLSAAPARLACLAGTDKLPEHHFTGRIDEAAIQAARALRRLLLARQSDPLAIEAGAAAFLARLVQSGGIALRPAHARSLTPRRLRIVEELMDANLAAPLSVSDMAAACGLSAGFFLRAFKAATGETPHRALISRRIAATRHLLARGDDGLAEIAQRTGFSSQAHMTLVFSKEFGMTPSAYRAAERTVHLS